METLSAPAADWMTQAACRGLPTELFISAGDEDDEPWEPPAAVQAICYGCPVRPECLAFAIRHETRGTWGGTSFDQRRQLRRVRQRLACSVCASTDTAVVGAYQFCLSCGMSWRT